MRAGFRYRSEDFSAPRTSMPAIEWQQAGLTSIAYRLAHVALPRSLAITIAFLLFYLG
jgi:hypothetical protein